MNFFLVFLQFCILLTILSKYSHAEELKKSSDDGPLDPSLYFDLKDPQWLTWIGQFSKGIDRCPLNTDEQNSVRVCTRAQFYGPAGVTAMKRSGELYVEHRNDMVLVLVSGCVICPTGFGEGEITMSLMQFHPEGSTFTSCYQKWENVSAITIRPTAGSVAPIPFIIGAVFSERRCHGLFSTDAIRMQYSTHHLLLEHVHCNAAKDTREIPLQTIHTEDYENRALEYVFSAPLDLSRTDRSLRQMQIWGVPPELGQSKILKFSNIDCGRVLANDTDYTEERATSPKTISDPGDTLPLDCGSIRARYFHFDHQQNDNRNGTDYPLAFIRGVYQDYLFIEMEFASSYAPQNWYCYAIDEKSPRIFRQQIHSLAMCFPNVLVTSPDNEYVMDSRGHNYIQSCMECMKLLMEKSWHYAILLQNDDLQMKTNDEMVQIFKWMNGTNDIQFTRIGSTHVNFEGNNWSLDNLKLFRNESKNRADLVLQKNKGTSAVSLTKAFVHWLLNELDVSIMLDQLNTYDYAVDEYFIQTLAANEFMEAPGGFTQKCFNEELAPGITRMAIWAHVAGEFCRSGTKRHSVCILGLKDLVPNLNGSIPFLFANKMLLKKDAEAIQCWHEQMFNRTFLHPTLNRLNQSFYTELPQVRYNEEKRIFGDTFDVNTFNCRYKFINEIKQYQELWGEYKGAIRHFKSASDFAFCEAIEAEAMKRKEL